MPMMLVAWRTSVRRMSRGNPAGTDLAAVLKAT